MVSDALIPQSLGVWPNADRDLLEGCPNFGMSRHPVGTCKGFPDKKFIGLVYNYMM